MNYEKNDSSFLERDVMLAAFAIAISIIQGLNHYKKSLAAYTEQSKKRFLKRQPASKRQLLSFIEYSNRMAFETAKEHGDYCPYCGYLVIFGTKTIENETKIQYCPMCNEIISAEDIFHQIADQKKSLSGVRS